MSAIVNDIAMSPPQADIGMLASQGNIGNYVFVGCRILSGRGVWWCLDPSQLFVSCFTSLAASMRRSAATSRVLSTKHQRVEYDCPTLLIVLASFDLQRLVAFQGRWGDASSSSAKRKRGGDPLLPCTVLFVAVALIRVCVHPNSMLWFFKFCICTSRSFGSKDI